MAINSKKLKELVVKEATALKEKATKKELNNLDFGQLNPISSLNCVYGQMAGHCDSDRAIQLMKECCERVYERGTTDVWNSFIGVKLNGSPQAKPRERWFSPIEVFIIQRDNEGENNKKLIDFLKGKTETLEL